MPSTPRQKTPARKPESTEPSKPAAQPAGRSGAAAAPALKGPAQPPGESEQKQLFERASSSFQKGAYDQAAALFEAAARGPHREMAHSARQHIAMCRQRLGRQTVTLRTPDELYDYAITLLNARRLAEAEPHLRQALSQAPQLDHLHYAFALCRGLSGDLETACQHLRRAIEINPRNRVTARNDPDFAEIGRTPPLAGLLYPGGTASSS